MNSIGRWSFCPSLAALLAMMFGAGADRSAPAQPPGPPLASPVVVAPVTAQEIRAGQTFVGTVMPMRMAAIGSAVDGRVVEYPVNEGDRVQSGQKLAQLLTETIRLEHEAACADLRLKEEQLRELKNGTRAEEVEMARARMEANKAKAAFQKSQHERARTLYQSQKAIAESDLEQAFSAYINAQETYLESKAAHAMAVTGPRPEQIAQSEAQVAAQRAVCERLADQLTKHTIIARFDGYVTKEHTEVGAWVNRGELVAEIAYLDQVDVQAHVLESHVPHVQKGQVVRVEIPALPDKVFTGTVALVVPQAEERSRTFPVKVRIENVIDERNGPLIKAGMLARVTLPTGAAEKALLVPKDALVLGGPKPVVFVVDPTGNNGRQGKVRPVPVELGVADGQRIQVKGELKEGQAVITLGNERVRPGQDVLVTRAAQ